ncbi:MAG: pyridoxal phosphate-dependent aminotransferase [Clostridia bacterium]|nr:pyridoxal phosphate-dependent aminotransferase [Clostridia bacterium]
MELSKRALAVKPSLTLAITAKANKLKAEGKDLIAFTAGEPDFRTPDYIVEGAKEALRKGFTKYTPASGTPELKKAIAHKLFEDNGLEYQPSQIVVSNGAKQSLFNSLQVLVNPGDEVIVVEPYWLTYTELIVICGGVPVILHTREEEGFKLNPKKLESLISPKTKAVIINSPNNPTGVVYTKEEIEAIAAVLEKYEDVAIISDEIYEKLVYNGHKHYSIAAYSPSIKERTFVINGMSKAYAMTGWRIGYVACAQKFATAMGSLQSHQTSNPNSIAQYASVVGLTSGKEVMDEMVETFQNRRALMLDELKHAKSFHAFEGDGAFYVMLNISGFIGKEIYGKQINGAIDIAEVLLDRGGVVVIPCECFGTANYVRLSYALSEKDIVEGVRRIIKCLDGV